MAGFPYSPHERHEPQGRLLRVALAAAVLASGSLVVALFLSAVSTMRQEAKLQAGSGEGQAGVSDLEYPATLIQQVGQPAGGDWLLPAAVAVLGDGIFVADTGSRRILRLDRHGQLAAVLDGSTVEGLDLQHPMALAADGQRLYIADSTASRVVVLDPSGRMERVLALPAVLPGERPPRPIGVAPRAGGRIVVSDAENHRVLLLDADGRIERAVGAGTRAGGAVGFNVPGALAVDAAGNIYVADTLNGRVVKLSPDGSFAAEFGKLGVTAGSLSRPKGVAVDAAGRVFVSDALQSAVQVFGPGGTPLGIIGRRVPGDATSGSLFPAPGGLWLEGGRLYVMDRLAGLGVLALPAQP